MGDAPGNSSCVQRGCVRGCAGPQAEFRHCLHGSVFGNNGGVRGVRSSRREGCAESVTGRSVPLFDLLVTPLLPSLGPPWLLCEGVRQTPHASAIWGLGAVTPRGGRQAGRPMGF